MKLASLAVRLRELFETLQELKSRPIILLVHDQELTRSVLQCAGVDISQCQIGIQNLLHYQESEVCASWCPGLIISNILHYRTPYDHPVKIVVRGLDHLAEILKVISHLE